MTSVLIVDGNPSTVAALQDKLRALGYSALSSLSADGALEAVTCRQVDVMIADLDLATRPRGLGGPDLMQRIREVSPETRSLVMSPNATAQDYKRALERGAVEVLTMPIADRDLIDAMRKAAECDDGFRANVHGLSIVDFLQLMHHSRRSLIVRMSGAMIYMQDGEVVHAVAPPYEGRQALRALLSARTGTLATSPFVPCPQTINLPFEHLLLDLLRELDEAVRDRRASGSHPAIALPATDGDGIPKVSSALLQLTPPQGRLLPIVLGATGVMVLAGLGLLGWLVVSGRLLDDGRGNAAAAVRQVSSRGYREGGPPRPVTEPLYAPEGRARADNAVDPSVETAGSRAASGDQDSDPAAGATLSPRARLGGAGRRALARGGREAVRATRTGSRSQPTPDQGAAPSAAASDGSGARDGAPADGATPANTKPRRPQIGTLGARRPSVGILE